MKKIILIILILVSIGALLGCKLPSSDIKKTSIYQITFVKNDITAEGSMTVQKIKSKATAKLTANSFTKLGSSFAGWAKTADGTVSFPDKADFTMGKENVTFYAKWNANPYTITFNANGGVGADYTQTILSGLSENLTANSFTKTGTTFAGWATSVNGEVIYSDSVSYTMGTENVTLYAKWSTNPSYTISFKANGGIGTDYTQSIISGLSVNLLSNSFTNTGLYFAGWATTDIGTVTYNDCASYVMGTENITLYAVWSINPSYIITFKANGGVGADSIQTITSGLSANLTTNTFTRIGYTFAGWSTTNIGPVAFSQSANYTMGTANVTLYAKWTINPSYTITFKANGGVGADYTQTIVSGLSANLTANTFSRAGYTFAGWATTNTGPATLSQSVSYTMGSENVTLFAVWTINPSYIVTFNSNGGIGSMAAQTMVNGLPTPLAINEFSKTGYDFAGWAITETGNATFNDRANYTIGSANIILYATWQRWTRLLGTSNSYTSGEGIVVDSSGNSYISGYHFGTYCSILISKYDSLGTLIWTIQLGGGDTSWRIGWGIAIDLSGNVYVSGATYGNLDGQTKVGLEDIFICKFNSSGEKQWLKLLGISSAYSQANAISVDSIGNSYITGETGGSLDGQTLTGTYDMFVSKYDTSGVKQWTKLLGTSGEETHGNGISVDSSGNSYITGHTGGNLDGQTITGIYDMFVAKYNSAGVKQWTKLLGVSTKDTRGNGITIDTSGNSFITGYSTGSLDSQILTGTKDMFISKYDTSGVKQWTKLLGVNGKETNGNGIAIDSSGNCFVAGDTTGNLDGQVIFGSINMFVSKYNSSGAKQWTKVYGGSGMSEAKDIAVDSSGICYATGSTYSSLAGQTKTGYMDMFITTRLNE